VVAFSSEGKGNDEEPLPAVSLIPDGVDLIISLVSDSYFRTSTYLSDIACP
jgi:hypothetical protein